MKVINFFMWKVLLMPGCCSVTTLKNSFIEGNKTAKYGSYFINKIERETFAMQLKERLKFMRTQYTHAYMFC